MSARLLRVSAALALAAPVALWGCAGQGQSTPAAHDTTSASVMSTEVETVNGADAAHAPALAVRESYTSESDTPCVDVEVYFADDESSLDVADRVRLEQLAECVRDGEARDVTLVGHTDPRGTPEESELLALQRAESVRDFLISQGCDPELFRIHVRGEQDASARPRDWAADRAVVVDVDG